MKRFLLQRSAGLADAGVGAIEAGDDRVVVAPPQTGLCRLLAGFLDPPQVFVIDGGNLLGGLLGAGCPRQQQPAVGRLSQGFANFDETGLVVTKPWTFFLGLTGLIACDFGDLDPVFEVVRFSFQHSELLGYLCQFDTGRCQLLDSLSCVIVNLDELVPQVCLKLHMMLTVFSPIFWPQRAVLVSNCCH